jgi:hypothetical protein
MEPAMSRSTWCMAIALASQAALAGPYDRAWAVVESGDRSDTRQEFPVAITQVDGQSTRNPRGGDALEPGKHTVRVRFETARVQQSEAEKARDLELMLEPCMRYRIAARRTQSTGTEWEPKVYPEKIGECARKFK